MREFRIFNPHTQEFVYSGLTPSMLAGFFKHTATLDTVDGQAYEQSTGSEDENGKMIFEGDGYVDEEGYGVWIEWENDNSCYAFHGTTGHQEDIMCHHLDKMDLSKNIHQNPEVTA